MKNDDLKTAQQASTRANQLLGATISTTLDGDLFLHQHADGAQCDALRISVVDLLERVKEAAECVAIFDKLIQQEAPVTRQRAETVDS